MYPGIERISTPGLPLATGYAHGRPYGPQSLTAYNNSRVTDILPTALAKKIKQSVVSVRPSVHSVCFYSIF